MTRGSVRQERLCEQNLAVKLVDVADKLDWSQDSSWPGTGSVGGRDPPACMYEFLSRNVPSRTITGSTRSALSRFG
jgi:hypothetical protein